MILNASIITLLREYFSSGLPRSKWNYGYNRFTGEEEVKDKEGWVKGTGQSRQGLQIEKGDKEEEFVD